MRFSAKPITTGTQSHREIVLEIYRVMRAVAATLNSVAKFVLCDSVSLLLEEVRSALGLLRELHPGL
jgi:hypothetical protein